MFFGFGPKKHSVSRLSAISMAVFSSTTADAEQPPRPILSEAYVVADAQAAFDEIRIRWNQAQLEQQDRLAAFEGDLSEFKRSDPILQRVSWTYELCNDVVSLIPPPMEGWGISSDFSFTENPVKEDTTLIGYKRFVPDPTSDDEASNLTEEYVQFNISQSPERAQGFELYHGNETMRSRLLKPGPYNYPLMLDDRAILGEFAVLVTASNPEVQKAYLAEIIECARASGLIASHIDLSTLSAEP